MADHDRGLLCDLAEDAKRVVRERAQRIVGGASTLPVPARVVRDRAIARRKAREDVLPVLGAREALMQEHDRRLARLTTAGVVVRELGVALERARARKALRHRLGLDRRGGRPQEEPPADHEVPRPGRDGQQSLD